MHILANVESYSTHTVHSHAVAIHSVVICYFKETLRKSHMPLRCEKVLSFLLCDPVIPSSHP